MNPLADLRAAIDAFTIAFENNAPVEAGAPLAIADAQEAKDALADMRKSMDALEAIAARHP